MSCKYFTDNIGIKVQEKDNINIRKLSYSIFRPKGVACDTKSQSTKSNFIYDEIYLNHHYSFEDLGVGVSLYDVENQSNDANEISMSDDNVDLTIDAVFRMTGERVVKISADSDNYSMSSSGTVRVEGLDPDLTPDYIGSEGASESGYRFESEPVSQSVWRFESGQGQSFRIKNDEEDEVEMEQNNIDDIFTNEQNNGNDIFTITSVAEYIDFLNKRLSMNNDPILNKGLSYGEAFVDDANNSVSEELIQKVREGERNLMTLKGKNRKGKKSVFIENIDGHLIAPSPSGKLTDIDKEKDLNALKKRNKKTSVFVDDVDILMDSSLLEEFREREKDLRSLTWKGKEKASYLDDHDNSTLASPSEKLSDVKMEMVLKRPKGWRIDSPGKKSRIACSIRPNNNRQS